MDYQRVCAKINISAIEENVAGVRRHIPEKTMIMAIVKADAYGHGAAVLADELADKVEWFGVSNVTEAAELRRAGIVNPILVLGYVDPREYSAAVENDITLAVFSYADAEKLSNTARSLNKTANVHIKVDTGMSRIGFRVSEDNADEAVRIAALDSLQVQGLFSHFARADERDKTSANKQLEAFSAFDKMLKDRGLHIPVRHIENSAGIMELDCPYEMVRMGIMLYGLYPSDEVSRDYKLHPAMELVSHLSMVKTLKKGDGVSYGHTYVAEKAVKVATVPVGYADGYPRCLSNKGYVLVNGIKCPIIGRICMDQMMIDVTDAGNVAVGDDVVLVGNMGDETISADDIAEAAGTINYEIVCEISRRVPRAYIKDGRLVKTVSYI